MHASTRPPHIAAAKAFLFNIVSSFHWAWMDMVCRYRRSVIGPFWETINVLVLILGISFVAGAVFNSNMMDMLTYVGLGIIIWTAMLSYVNEGTTCFMQHRDLIRNSTLGIGVYVGRYVFRISIAGAHHFVLYFVALLLLPMPLSATTLLAIPGLIILFLNAIWVMPTLGMLCARFRDLEMVIRNFMQLVFFVTPIFWDVSIIQSNRQFMVDYNPLYYFIEVIRAPLLGHIPPLEHYLVLGAITVAGYGLLWFVHRKLRAHLAFYV